MSISSTAGTISSPGIGSGLDVNGIVSKLMSVEQQPLVVMQQKEASFQSELSSVGTLQSALSTFQNSLQSIENAASFSALSATSSDTSTLTASVAAGAQAGSYSVQVNALAQQQNVASQGYADTTSTIGTGTLTFQFGTIQGGTLSNGVYTGASFNINSSAASQTVTIDSAHNSLSGIRDAINGANIGVTASIVNDGSSTNPYRLVLTSKNSGAANSLKITSSDPGLQGLTYDPAGTQNMTQLIPAQDANITLNGMTITRSSNTMSDAIQGVTLNLLKVNTSPVTVSMAQDTSGVSSSIQNFVTAYNDLQKTFTQLAGYDATTKQAGPLEGDFSVSMVQDQIKQTIYSSMVGLRGGNVNLSDIGITFQKDGTLSLDSTKLASALSSDPKAVSGMFAATGVVSDSLISYNSSGTSTQPGTYAINVTQLATQGQYTGGSAVTTPLTISTGVNDQLNLAVNGVSVSVTLSPATYSDLNQVAADMQSKINGASAMTSAGLSVSVTQNNGIFNIATTGYGSAMTITQLGGTAAASLGLTGGTSTTGIDVAGTIGGASATGSAQYLTASPGNGADGLKLQVLGGATGDRGTVSYAQGVAYQLDQLLTTTLGAGGAIDSLKTGINSSITQIQQQQTDLQQHLTDVQAMYQKQYSDLDTLISSMNQTQSALTQELASIPKP